MHWRLHMHRWAFVRQNRWEETEMSCYLEQAVYEWDLKWELKVSFRHLFVEIIFFFFWKVAMTSERNKWNVFCFANVFGLGTHNTKWEWNPFYHGHRVDEFPQVKLEQIHVSSNDGTEKQHRRAWSNGSYTSTQLITQLQKSFAAICDASGFGRFGETKQ